ncbi:hypothetical protein CDIK_4355 [Cucumispora dikerogammari]|nr:hypothetical protein CDIK_4355 [Cucumispora dikerogammari]
METRRSLSEKLKHRDGAVLFCMNLGLIKKFSNCKFCGKRMVLAKHQREDGFIWACWSFKCKKFKRSIRHCSFLEGIKLPLKDIIMILYEWCQETTIKRIKHEYGIQYKAVNQVLNVIRKIIADRKGDKIGGIGEIVEIDETCLSTRKNYKGRVLRNMWCVGGISRETKKFFLTLSTHRDMVNLDEIITKNVEVDTLIMTDCWKAI